MTLTLITGGSRGLGFATAAALKEQGHELILVSKDPSRLTAAAEQLGARRYAINLEDIDNVESSFMQIIDECGVPDNLIASHGVMSDRMAKTLRTNMAEWRRVMSINLDSTFSAVNIFGAAMNERRSGRIIIFSACLGRMSGPGNAGGLAPYRISKAGVNALVRNLAHETNHGSRGLFVDAVCPNHSRTDMGGENAPLSAEEGAQTAIWLATRELIPGETKTGLLWEEKQPLEW